MLEKITIITISYNSEKTIEETILSVLNQTYRPLEYILVDGGSTDRTMDISKNYISAFQEKKIDFLFKSEADRGISDAFNKGILLSSGAIIGIINSDDCLADGAIEHIMKVFDDETDVVCGDCLWVDKFNGLMYVRKSRMELDKLKYEMVLMHPTCFVKKSAYEQYGLYDIDLRYVMDKELMARFYNKGAKFKYIPQVIAIMSAGGTSDVNTRKVYQEGVEVAVRNGVPKWKAELRWRYKNLLFVIVGLIKRNEKLWCVLKKKNDMLR